VRQIAVKPFGGINRLASFYEATGKTRRAQTCIVEIKGRCDVRDCLRQISRLLHQRANVELSARDEQFLALP
jgi:hypothetical protein